MTVATPTITARSSRTRTCCQDIQTGNIPSAPSRFPLLWVFLGFCTYRTCRTPRLRYGLRSRISWRFRFDVWLRFWYSCWTRCSVCGIAWLLTFLSRMLMSNFFEVVDVSRFASQETHPGGVFAEHDVCFASQCSVWIAEISYYYAQICFKPTLEEQCCWWCVEWTTWTEL